jgi:fucose 4-O-acetylase-like acetyltransferase
LFCARVLAHDRFAAPELSDFRNHVWQARQNQQSRLPMQQERNPLLDNAKGLLIGLVVLGHFLDISSREHWGARWIHDSIYLFHMPMFVFLAGITAKSTQVFSRVVPLLILLICFQGIYVAPYVIVKGAYPAEFFQPYWILWFLLSMVFWQLALPVAIKIPGILSISVVVALAAGAIDQVGYSLSASRTCVFFPFFLAGHFYGQKALEVAATKRLNGWIVSAVVLAIGALFVQSAIGYRWLYGALGYEALDSSILAGFLTRTTLLIIAAAVSALVLCAIPTKRGWLSILGQRSLAIYLFHGFFVKAIRGMIGDRFDDWTLTLIALISSGITIWTLSLPVFLRIVRLFAVTDRLSRMPAKS